MKVPDLYVGKRLFVGQGIPPIALGLGPTEIRGSAYIQGPSITGAFPAPNPWATVMIGPNLNPESLPCFIPGVKCFPLSNPYSLAVIGSSAFMNNIDTDMNVNVGLNLYAQGNVISNCGGHVLAAKKNFDIPHPSKKGWRLRHTCPEGPQNDVYVRGRLKNRKNIVLPEYWKDFVDIQSITVSITPIGAPQDIFVKRIALDKILLESNSVIPINCHYHVYGERTDGERLIPEYEGDSPADYPGNNEEYSVAGYHYDVKENTNG